MTAGERASIIRMLQYYGRLCDERRLALALILPSELRLTLATVPADMGREVADHREKQLELWMQRARDALQGQYNLYDDWMQLVRSLVEQAETKELEPVSASFAHAKAKADAEDRMEARLVAYQQEQAAEARARERQRSNDRIERRRLLAAWLEEMKTQ
jgi:hypothetical protein